MGLMRSLLVIFFVIVVISIVTIGSFAIIAKVYENKVNVVGYSVKDIKSCKVRFDSCVRSCEEDECIKKCDFNYERCKTG